MLLTILADDLTGACDTGALFTGRGPVAVFVDPDAPGAEWPVAALDIETRALPAGAIPARIERAAGRLRPRVEAGRLFKKIDSTMRGHVGVELDALLATTRLECALVCSAFPEQGRRIDHGVLTVDGRPAHETAIGQDPAYPTGGTSSVERILAASTRRPVVRLPLDEVRGAGQALERALSRAPGGLLAADAETLEDLDTLARAAASHPHLLLAGSAGLGRAVSRFYRTLPKEPVLPRGSAWLFVAGSLHPATRAQAAALVAAPIPTLWVAGDREPSVLEAVAALERRTPALIAPRPALIPPTGADRDAMAESLARATAAVVAKVEPDLLAVTGGEVLLAVFRALGARRLELTGAPASGLALGVLVLDGERRVPVVTKAGGFGAPELWLNLVERGSSEVVE
jgi:D-threonate/D-erythronate kinase